MVERDPVKIEVRGSNPRGGANWTSYFDYLMYNV